ncbi:hypothetical protein V8E53_001656 [Lactarius tabidus]
MKTNCRMFYLHFSSPFSSFPPTAFPMAKVSPNSEDLVVRDRVLMQPRRRKPEDDGNNPAGSGWLQLGSQLSDDDSNFEDSERNHPCRLAYIELNMKPPSRIASAPIFVDQLDPRCNVKRKSGKKDRLTDLPSMLAAILPVDLGIARREIVICGSSDSVIDLNGATGTRKLYASLLQDRGPKNQEPNAQTSLSREQMREPAPLFATHVTAYKIFDSPTDASVPPGAGLIGLWLVVLFAADYRACASLDLGDTLARRHHLSLGSQA